MAQCLIQRALREAERSAGHRGAEHVQRAHGELEAFALGPEALAGGDAAVPEGERGEGVGGDEVDARRAIKSRPRCVHDEGADAAGRHRSVRSPLRLLGAREHAVEVRDTAVRYPGLLAIEHVVIAHAPCTALERCGIRARSRLRQCERGDRLARGHGGQIAAFELLGSRKRDRPAPEPLHREGEIGEPVVPGQGLAYQGEGANVEARRRGRAGAGGTGYAVARPARLSECADALAAGGIDRLTIFEGRLGRELLGGPALQCLGELAVLGIEERLLEEAARAWAGEGESHRQLPSKRGGCFATNAR